MNTALRIAIVGAGPGGLTLARILTRHGVAVTVFERERSPLERPQGGTLDLHLESGQLALRHADLEDAFKRIARYEDQGSRLMDHHGNLVFEDPNPEDGDRPEVDRTQLRQMLLDSLPEGCVQWGVGIQHLRPIDHARWTLHQDGHTYGPFDLVVGADGAWSKVRPLLSSYPPQYSGLTFIEFNIADADRQHPHIARLVGRGTFSVHGEAKAIIVQRNANAHLRGYAVFRVPTDWAANTLDLSNALSMKTQFKGWHPDVLALFEAASPTLLVRPIYALPVGHHWVHRPGLTLIGDAAHLMSPFGGEGVNAAMLDAAELAQHLLEALDGSKAIQAYENHMFERVMPAAQGSAEGAALQLSHDSLALSLAHLHHHLMPQ